MTNTAVQVNLYKSESHITFILNTGFGLNIIKENFVPKDSIINYNNVLKLKKKIDINEYSVYILGEIFLPFLRNKVAFHIVVSNFPIS